MDSSPRRRLAWWVLLALLAAWAGLSLLQAAVKSSGPGGSIDFHSYWYYGHFVWQGVNPYAAYQEQREPELPIHYLDGVEVVTPPVAQPDLARTPANTAPILLLLAPLARFSWPTARAIWLVCNLALIVAIPWLVLRLLPMMPAWRWQALTALIFWGMKSTRLTAWVGQTSLLVLALMLVAVSSRKRNPWLAGVMLGIALSKYSLALPVALLFLVERRFRALSVAVGVQIAGLLVVSSVAGASPLETFQSYLQIMFRHTDLPGIHLTTFFGGNEGPAYITAGLGTLGVGIMLLRWRRHHQITDAALAPLLTVLSMWTLLVAYHRSYDAILFIFFVVAAIAVLAEPGLSRYQAWLLIGVLIATLAPTNLPGGLALGGLLPAEFAVMWDLMIERSITLAAGVMLVVALWLLQRTPREGLAAP